MISTSESDDLQPSRPIQILIIESDPVARLGLVTYLGRFSDLQIVAEAETSASASRILADRMRRAPTLDLLLLSLPLQPAAAPLSDLEFCQQVRATYPLLPLLVLATIQEQSLAQLLQMGIAGCVVKGDSLLNLIVAIRQVAAGQSSWSPQMLQQLTAIPTKPLSSWQQIRSTIRSTSLQQVESSLAQINSELRSPNLSLPYYLLLTGQKRELKAAARLIQLLFPASKHSPVASSRSSGSSSGSSSASVTDSVVQTALANSIQPSMQLSASSSITATEQTPSQVQAQLFDGIAAALQSNLENLTAKPLEIDILRIDKRRELLLLVLQQIERFLEELRFSRLPLEQLTGKQSAILQDLWVAITTEFFGRYSTVPGDRQSFDLVPILLQDAPSVQREVLDKIPQVSELLSHLLFQTSLPIDAIHQPFGTSEAFYRASQLLENLIVHLANAVIQPLLNHFAESETVKHQFYARSRLSTREIERFRNDLSWRYRMEHHIRDPQAMFESRYMLYCFNSNGIIRTAIYAPRRQELEQLKGTRFLVTLILELRDAIAPRFRSVITFIGSSSIYLLTEVIGRSIGLVGRGIAKGIGNSWQENRRSNTTVKINDRWR